MKFDKTQTDMRNELLALAQCGKLTCAEAHHFAELEGVSLVTVGKLVNEAGIKISDCQLGCFGKHKES
jgi:hypothetical protein